jgi:mediator of RNA polymerase II transcription subunit 7
MAENSDISALYPPPPPFYKFFTAENVTKFNELRKSGESDESISQIPDIKFLLPPNQPDKQQYRSFGDLWWFEDKQVGLKESGIVQIYGDSSHDGNNTNPEEDEEDVFSSIRINELKKMTKSLLLNFLELIGILAKNPELGAQKIDNIRTILINIHHLLNSYRLHQSRETLILTMQKKLAQAEDEIRQIKDTYTNVEQKLSLLVNRLNQSKTSNQKSQDMKNRNIELSSASEKMYTVPDELRREAENALLKQINS